MTTATHVIVGPTDTVTVLDDGRVRVSAEGRSVVIEVRDAGSAHRLASAFAEVGDTLATEKERRLGLLAMVEAVA